MLNKIEKELNEFTGNIKEVKGCDEMLAYINSSQMASIKLLMFASSTFSLIGRLILFLVIASAGLLMSSAIGAIPVSGTLLLGTNLFLFVLILIYISHYRKILINSIANVKSLMKKDK